MAFGTEDFLYPRPAFYAVSAQIIPVLILAFAVEDRANRFLSHPQMKLYRAQLFLFLIGGEALALLGVSGAMRGSAESFAEGQVADSAFWQDLIAAGTTMGLIGGFVMVAVLALSGPGWLLLTFPQRRGGAERELDALRLELDSLKEELRRSGRSESPPSP